MRPLFVCNSRLWGGAEQYIVRLADALAARGHSPRVAAPPDSPLHEAAAGAGLPVDPLDLGPKLSNRTAHDLVLNWRAYGSRMRAFLDESRARHDVDVLHLQFKKEQLLGTAAAAAGGLPVVWTEHGAVPAGIRAIGPVRDRYRRAAERAARILCVSQYVHADVAALGVPPQRLVVVYNGMEPAAAPAADAARIRLELGLGAGDLLVGAVCRLTPLKGLFDLVDAAAIVLAWVPQARFVVAGEGPMRAAVEGRIRRNGIGNRMRLLGHRPDASALIAALDVLVSPSHSEGFSLVVLEGMNAGRAIVATRVGGVPELLEDGRVGALVEPRRPTLLAQAITALLHDEVVRATLGETARKRAALHFTLERMLARTEAELGAAARRAPEALGAAGSSCAA